MRKLIQLITYARLTYAFTFIVSLAGLSYSAHLSQIEGQNPALLVLATFVGFLSIYVIFFSILMFVTSEDCAHSPG